MNLHLLHPTRIRNAKAPDFKNPLHPLETVEPIGVKEYGLIRLRPIQVEDEQLVIKFHENLSEEDIYHRYFAYLSLNDRTPHERLAKVCLNTAESFAIVAERVSVLGHPSQILAIGRLAVTEVPGVVAFAVLMGNSAQKTKLPRHVLDRLIAISRAYGFRILCGELLETDTLALQLCRTLGFTFYPVPEDKIIKVSRSLKIT